MEHILQGLYTDQLHILFSILAFYLNSVNKGCCCFVRACTEDWLQCGYSLHGSKNTELAAK